MVRPRRLVLVGSVLIDVLLYVDRLPERGSDTIARRGMVTTGGGFNLLSAAARLGLAVAYGGTSGGGPFGDRARRDLEGAGVASLLPYSPAGDTGFDVALVEAGGERTFVTSPGVEAELRTDQLEQVAARLGPGDAVYVSGYDLAYPVSGPCLADWLPTVRGDRLLVFDPGPLVGEIPSRRLDAVLARVDLISMNAREAAILTGRVEPEAATAEMPARIRPGGSVVVRLGAEGCWVTGGRPPTAPVHLAGRPAKVVDTTGAGDVFLGALLAALSEGRELLPSARFANAAASISVERTGPSTGPVRSEVEAILTEEGEG